MAVIVSHKIRQREFGSTIPDDARDVLIRSSRVALASPIASKSLPPGTRLLKAYATSAGGPRRIAYLLAVDSGALFLLLYRDKNDELGANMTPKNSAFASQIKKHLAFLEADIDAGKFEVIETD